MLYKMCTHLGPLPIIIVINVKWSTDMGSYVATEQLMCVHD